MISGGADRIGMLGTALVHLGLIGAGVWTSRHQSTPEPQMVYAIDLVAASAPTARQPQRNTPPVPPSRSPEETPVPKPQPTPARTPPRQEPDLPVRSDPVKEPPRTETPLPGETPRNGMDVANVSIPGFESRYKWYLNNVHQQIAKRFPMNERRPGAPVVEIRFRILANGGIDSVAYVVESRNPSMNRQAMSAIEGAGVAKAFGPLPDGIDRLTISFVFKPNQP